MLCSVNVIPCCVTTAKIHFVKLKISGFFKSNWNDFWSDSPVTKMEQLYINTQHSTLLLNFACFCIKWKKPYALTETVFHSLHPVNTRRHLFMSSPDTVWTPHSSSLLCWVRLHWNALDRTFWVNSIFYNPYPVIQSLNFLLNAALVWSETCTQLRVLLFQSSWKWPVIRRGEGGEKDNGWVLWLKSKKHHTHLAHVCAHSVFLIVKADEQSLVTQARQLGWYNLPLLRHTTRQTDKLNSA